MDKSKQFIIWLDGFLNACGPSLNEEQTKIIKDKLFGIFEHEAGKTETSIPDFPIHYPNDFDVDTNEVYRC